MLGLSSARCRATGESYFLSRCVVNLEGRNRRHLEACFTPRHCRPCKRHESVRKRHGGEVNGNPSPAKCLCISGTCPLGGNQRIAATHLEVSAQYAKVHPRSLGSPHLQLLKPLASHRAGGKAIKVDANLVGLLGMKLTERVSVTRLGQGLQRPSPLRRPALPIRARLSSEGSNAGNCWTCHMYRIESSTPTALVESHKHISTQTPAIKRSVLDLSLVPLVSGLLVPASGAGITWRSQGHSQIAARLHRALQERGRCLGGATRKDLRARCLARSAAPTSKTSALCRFCHFCQSLEPDNQQLGAGQWHTQCSNAPGTSAPSKDLDTRWARCMWPVHKLPGTLQALEDSQERSKLAPKLLETATFGVET